MILPVGSFSDLGKRRALLATHQLQHNPRLASGSYFPFTLVGFFGAFFGVAAFGAFASLAFAIDFLFAALILVVAS